MRCLPPRRRGRGRGRSRSQAVRREAKAGRRRRRQRPPRRPRPASETHTAAPGAVEVSPGGVTTAVGADAESTEDEYSQACQAAKTWIDQQGGDRKSQVEPYLKMLQDARTPARSGHLQHAVGAAVPGPAGGRHRRGPGGRRLALLTIRITACEKVGYQRPAIHSRPRATASSSAPKTRSVAARCRRRPRTSCRPPRSRMRSRGRGDARDDQPAAVGLQFAGPPPQRLDRDRGRHVGQHSQLSTTTALVEPSTLGHSSSMRATSANSPTPA